MRKRIVVIRSRMVLGLQVFKSVIIANNFVLYCKCRKNAGYSCKSHRLFVPLSSIYKQKTSG